MRRKREIVAIILLPLLYLYVMKLPPVYLLGLLAFSSSTAMMEFYSMYRVNGLLRITGILSGLVILFTIYIGFKNIQLIMVVMLLLIVSVRLFDSRKGPENALQDIAPVVFGLFYIPLILGLLIPLRDAGPEWIVFLGGTVWTSDSLAYYTGKNLGRRKLYPSVSPKKTVEGAIGSVLGGGLAGAVIQLTLIDYITIYQALVSGGSGDRVYYRWHCSRW
jgi:phosphatidate cytidylyltransferase